MSRYKLYATDDYLHWVEQFGDINLPVFGSPWFYFHLRPKWWFPWQQSLPEARVRAERWMASYVATVEALAQVRAEIAAQMADADEVDALLETL